MEFRILDNPAEGLVAISYACAMDHRGWFSESFRADEFARLGLPTHFVQDNHSCSHHGVFRGLHYQWDPPMGKLMRVTRGSALLVAVDIRRRSTFGCFYLHTCYAGGGSQVWGEAGFARGFLALEENTEVQYKCTRVYNSQGEGAIQWRSVPGLADAISRVNKSVIVSEKDASAPSLDDYTPRFF